MNMKKMIFIAGLLLSMALTAFAEQQYDKQSHGIINDDGSIKWNSDFIEKYKAKSFENTECLSCKYLPICMGICPRDYGSASYCKFNGMDMKIEDALVNYINSMCNESK